MRPPLESKRMFDLPWVVSQDHRKISLKHDYSMHTMASTRPPNPRVNRTGSVMSFHNNQSSDMQYSSTIEPRNSSNVNEKKTI